MALNGKAGRGVVQTGGRLQTSVQLQLVPPAQTQTETIGVQVDEIHHRKRTECNATAWSTTIVAFASPETMGDGTST